MTSLPDKTELQIYRDKQQTAEERNFITNEGSNYAGVSFSNRDNVVVRPIVRKGVPGPPPL